MRKLIGAIHEYANPHIRNDILLRGTIKQVNIKLGKAGDILSISTPMVKMCPVGGRIVNNYADINM
jgi:hypothetical protein